MLVSRWSDVTGDGEADPESADHDGVGGEHSDTAQGGEQAVDRGADDGLAGGRREPAPDAGSEGDEEMLDDADPGQGDGHGQDLVADQGAEGDAEDGEEGRVGEGSPQGEPHVRVAEGEADALGVEQ